MKRKREARPLQEWIDKDPEGALGVLREVLLRPEVRAALRHIAAVTQSDAVREAVAPYTLGPPPPLREVREAALLMRLRTKFAADGLHFRRPGRDRTALRAHGAWYAIDDGGHVKRSAAKDGHPNETLRELAQRIGQLAAWEK